MKNDARWLRSVCERAVAEEMDELPGELAAALGQRRYDALPAVAARVVRCAIAAPERALLELGPVHVMVDEIVFALLRTESRQGIPPHGLMAIVDLLNAIETLGAPLRSTCQAIARSWLPDLIDLDPLARLRVGFAALALNDVALANRVVELEGGHRPHEPNQRRIGRDVAGILSHIIVALEDDNRANAVRSLVGSAIKTYGSLSEAQLIDEPTLLWIARLAIHDVGKEALGRVAATLHGYVWGSAEWQLDVEQDLARGRAQFPLMATLDRRRYQVIEHVDGEGSQALYLGRRATDKASVLISYAHYDPKDVEALRSRLAYRGDRLLELAFVGPFDTLTNGNETACAVVEVATPGEWLPRIVPVGQKLEAGVAVRLGRSIGEILALAAARGIMLTRARPEYMWAYRRGDEIEVTGLSARGDDLFVQADRYSRSVFDRYYFAPETYGPSCVRGDDRSLAFSLAIMIAEWVMGYYPFAKLWYAADLTTGTHVPLRVPAELARLLSAAMQRDRDRRPRLASFLSELERWAAAR